MEPGNFLVKCETAWLEPIGSKGYRAVLQFRVVDGKYDGVALRQWVMVSDGGGVISPTGRFARYCTLALGRPLQSGDPLNDPGQIFSGRFFLVQVGYRKTEKAKGGMASDDNATHCKDERDYLRVHDMVSREDL
jgi:hypothetical protein